MVTTDIDANLVSALQAKDSSPKQSTSDDNLQARLISTHHALASPLYECMRHLWPSFMCMETSLSQALPETETQSDERRAIPPLGFILSKVIGRG